MLYSTPSSELKYATVLDFIKENHREGIGLDYKEAFPKALEKTICALANTNGGIIVIGIKDNDGYPDQQSLGMKTENGLAERVTRIAIDNIFPPITPEIVVCAEGELCFVVVKVPQGRETPYTVRRNQVYIRTGNVNTPDDLATLDRIDWLAENRRKAAELRKRIIGAMATRATNRQTIQEITIPFGVVSMSFGPLFPYEPLFSDKQMPNLRNQLMVYAYGIELPSGMASSRSVQGGISYYEHHKSSNDFNYLEINKFGYFYFLEDMGIQKLEKDEKGVLQVTERKFEPYRIVRAADILLNSARKLYGANRFAGDYRLTVQVDKLFNIPVHAYPHPNRWMSGNDPKVSVDNQLLWGQIWSPSELESYDLRTAKLLELGNEITFSLGFPNEEAFVRDMLNRYSPKDSDAR